MRGATIPQLAPVQSNGNGSGPKALSVPTFELPTFDDDDDDFDLEITQASGTDSVDNFMNSVLGLTKSPKSKTK